MDAQPEQPEKRPWWADDIRSAWRWLSVQVGALIAIAPELYLNTDIIKQYLSPTAALHVISLLGVLSVLNAVRNKESGK